MFVILGGRVVSLSVYTTLEDTHREVDTIAVERSQLCVRTMLSVCDRVAISFRVAVLHGRA